MALAALASLATVGALAAGPPPLPPPVLTADGPLLALAAAGGRAAVSSGCDVRVADLVRRSRPARVPRFGDCAGGEIAAVDDLHLGRSTLVAEEVVSPSPHGDEYSLWSGRLPRGPLRPFGDAWGWRDDDVPSAYGCAWSVASGGGVVALAQAPNTLGVDGVTRCAGAASTRIRLLGAARSSLTIADSWSILATDGRRLALARLDPEGAVTGEVELVGLDGSPLAPPRVDAKAVPLAHGAWLTGRTLVLQTTRGISGPGWAVRGAESATVGEGRVLYRLGRIVHVRRLRDGKDRALVRLPTANTLLAAGSFGLAVATGIAERTRLYRLPWRTIDRTLRR